MGSANFSGNTPSNSRSSKLVPARKRKHIPGTPKGLFSGKDGAVLQAMLDAAKAARKIIMKGYRGPHIINFKDPKAMKSWVTEVDKEAQAVIEKRLRAQHPRAFMIGEETWEKSQLGFLSRAALLPDPFKTSKANPKSHRPRPTKTSKTKLLDAFWVDSVDGTNNYVRSLGDFATSIGLTRNGRPYLGLVWDHIRNKVYLGRVGIGAWAFSPEKKKPWEQLHVSPNTDFRLALLGTSFPSNSEASLAHGMNVARINTASGGIRANGSGALGLTRVLDGLDGFFDMSTNGWDVAGGIPIILAAGGVVRDFDGKPLSTLNRRRVSIIAANNPTIAEEIQKELPAQKNVDQLYLDPYNAF